MSSPAFAWSDEQTGKPVSAGTAPAPTDSNFKWSDEKADARTGAAANNSTPEKHTFLGDIGLAEGPDVQISDYPHATLSGIQSMGRGISGAVAGGYNAFRHPIDTAKSLVGIPSQAAQIPAAIHDINQSPDPRGTYYKAAQETAGQGAGQALTALATDVIAKPVIKAAVVRPFARGLKAGLNPAIEAAPEAEVSPPRAPNTDQMLGRPYQPNPRYEPRPEPRPIPPRKGPMLLEGTVEQPAPFPESPPPEVLQARGLAVGGRAPVDRSAGLGEIPVAKPETAPPAAPVAPVRGVREIRKAVGPDLDRTLNEATNAAPPLARGIPLKQQLQAAVNRTAPVPAGFTSTPDSSLLRGFKYDPETQRFDAILNNGEHYAHGQVSPEQFENFKNAESQGSAWTKHIRQGPGTVQIEKIFQPSKAGTMTTESGEVIPKSKAGMTLDKQIQSSIGRPESTASRVRGVKAAAARIPAPGENLEELLRQSLEAARNK